MNIDVLQKTIHRLEVGGGLRYLRIAMLVLAVLILVCLYNIAGYKNMNTQEAMDSAQLGRNLAEGKGFTTLFIRPFSLHLVQKHNERLKNLPQTGNLPDPCQIRGMHPDLANPPFYPLVLAGIMYILPIDYAAPTQAEGFWKMRYKPDFFIAIFNQLLFLTTVALVFLLAKRLFNKNVAWFSVVLMLGTELLWKFSASGLSTMLLMLVFVGLAWCLVLLEEEMREPRWGTFGIYGLPLLAGLLVGAGALTRYSFGWLIVPVVLYIVILAGRQRIMLGSIVFLTFALTLTPWVVRNILVSDTPFGTATYKLLETSAQFSEHRLERSLDPDFSQVNVLRTFKDKLIAGSRQIVQNDLPKIGGSWVSAFFLAGLLVVYQHPGARRLRFFLVGCLAVLALLQAVGHTKLSDDSPEVNSENLLVLLVPLLLIYGSSLFFLLLDQVDWPARELRYVAMVAFVAFSSLPLILTLINFTRPFPLAYPPYYPAAVQTAASYVREDELMMSDVPWAVAWYGRTQCAWLTLNAQADFFTVNDYQKSVQALYLTQVTTDSPFMSHWYPRPGEPTWGAFILACYFRDVMKQSSAPPGFPLLYWKKGPAHPPPQDAPVAFWEGLQSFLLTARSQPIR